MLFLGSRAVASCDNFDVDVLLRTTDCQTFTLFPGDVLYLPKAVIHFATTDPDQVSAHLTVSIDRAERTWQELITTAALVADSAAASLVQSVLSDAATTYLGMPWYMLPSHDHEKACEELTTLVVGAQPWSLQSLLQTDTGPASTWISASTVRHLIQKLNNCDSEVGKDLHGAPLTGRALVHATAKIKPGQRWRRADTVPVSVNCGNTCVCRFCQGNSCDSLCDVSLVGRPIISTNTTHGCRRDASITL